MLKSASIYRKLVTNCKNSLDGRVDFSDPGIYEEVIALFQLLYKQAFHYFNSRHAPDAAEDLATQVAQAVWENLLTCEKLAGIRNEDTFVAFARKSAMYECWRVQNKLEKEKVVDQPQAESESEEEDDDWLQLLIDRSAAAEGVEYQNPQSIFRLIAECLMLAINRLKSVEQRTVIVLEYLTGLDDEQLAFVLGKSLAEIHCLRAQARRHGLDAERLGIILGISAAEMQAFLDQLKLAGVEEESVAHICGIAIDNNQSLRSQAKKMGLAADHEQVLAAALKLQGAAILAFRASLNAHPIQRFEVALSCEVARAQVAGARSAGKSTLAEDYETALILGTTRSNVQAMLSRAKQFLREDRRLFECISRD
jgi:DNA-directed RNA polymerase specialized sigma24 family protein